MLCRYCDNCKREIPVEGMPYAVMEISYRDRDNQEKLRRVVDICRDCWQLLPFMKPLVPTKNRELDD